MNKNSLLFKISLAFIALCITGIIMSAFTLVLTRYVFRISWPWLHTAIKIFAVWLVFVGAYVGMVTNDHFTIDMISKRLSKKNKKIHKIFVIILIIISQLFLLISSWDALQIGRARRDPATGISMIYIYLAVFVGTIMMLIFLFSRLIYHIKNYLREI